MKKLYKNIFVIFLASASVSLSAQPVTFTYTGGVQTYTVPVCVTSITVDVMGAKGGDGVNASVGGNGGRVQGTIAVTPGQVLDIYVGGVGFNCATCGTGGFNGGGGTIAGAGQEAGTGGGASDIRITPYALANRIFVAGGGGGGGFTGPTANGGAGGTLTGGTGATWNGYPGGTGGTQVSGGIGGIGSTWSQPNAIDGSLGLGGSGQGWSGGGGGGGGGYFGGGGGFIGGGGGGSNYADVGATAVTHTQGYQTGNGQVVITPINGVSNPGAITGSATICANGSGNYSIASLVGATSYTWTVPVGSTINSGQGTTAINITAGSTAGNISVTATFPCGTSSPTTLSLSINASPAVTANSTAATVCAGTSVTLTGGGATSYTWSGGVTNAVSFVPLSTLTYTVTGTGANGCTNTATTTVTVNPLPAVVANSTAAAVCAGGSVTLTGSGATTYAWSGGVTNAVSFVPVSTITYTLTGTGANGCINTATTTVTVNPLPTVVANATTTSVCAGSSVTLTGSGAATYAWSGGVINAVSFVPLSTLTYTVTGTSAAGCVNTATITITLHSLPTVVANSTAAGVCTGASVILTGSGAIYYSWSSGVSDGISFVPVSTATYTVTGTDANNCTNTATTTVAVNPFPVVTATASITTACFNDGAISLTGTPISGTWSGPGVTSSSFTPSLAGVGAQTATYNYTDANGCSSVATVVITVNFCTGLVDQTLSNGINIFPNPNNGTFTIAVDANVGDLTMEVTDMQGRVVYSSIENNVHSGFEKQISLDTQSSGLYFLRIIANGEQKIQKISVQK